MGIRSHSAVYNSYLVCTCLLAYTELSIPWKILHLFLFDAFGVALFHTLRPPTGKKKKIQVYPATFPIFEVYKVIFFYFLN